MGTRTTVLVLGAEPADAERLVSELQARGFEVSLGPPAPSATAGLGG